jgi:hypothetical protein
MRRTVANWTCRPCGPQTGFAETNSTSPRSRLLAIDALEYNFRFARDPGGTGRRGIADRFRYAEFAGLIWAQCSAHRFRESARGHGA